MSARSIAGTPVSAAAAAAASVTAASAEPAPYSHHYFLLNRSMRSDLTYGAILQQFNARIIQNVGTRKTIQGSWEIPEEGDLVSSDGGVITLQYNKDGQYLLTETSPLSDGRRRKVTLYTRLDATTVLPEDVTNKIQYLAGYTFPHGDLKDTKTSYDSKRDFPQPRHASHAAAAVAAPVVVVRHRADEPVVSKQAEPNQGVDSKVHYHDSSEVTPGEAAAGGVSSREQIRDISIGKAKQPPKSGNCSCSSSSDCTVM